MENNTSSIIRPILPCYKTFSVQGSNSDGGISVKVYFKELTIVTRRSCELINITDEVKKAVSESGIKNGIVLVFSKHTTTGVFINEAEKGLERDIPFYLKKLVVEEDNFFHHHFFYKDGRMAVNAWAHIRSVLVGLHAIVPLKDGNVLLGGRENIYLAEFDGPKERHVVVQIMGE
ncbi:MAG: YjbQ family protein [Thermoprotei archaeon]|nr:MAG: YjbQ family protein [Thermoprotei archaeon]